MSGEQWRGLTLHPLILGLVQSLPTPGSVWPRKKREQWLRVAENCLHLLYSDEPAAQAQGDRGEEE